MSSAPPQSSAPSHWTDAFPKARSDPSGITSEEVAQLVRTKQVGVDYVVVDVRRTDFESYAIKSAINLPAHSFYPTLPGIISVLSKVPIVIFHCNSCGSPRSRGRRVAGWYQDALGDAGITASTAKYLEGGIKEWIEKYAEDEELAVKLPSLE